MPDPQQFGLHAPAGQRVEGGEGLVHQQHGGLHGQGAGDLQALLHAARELHRELRPVTVETDHAQVLGPDGVALGAAQALEGEAEPHILLDGQPREQCGPGVLEEHDAIAPAGPEGSLVERDGSRR